MVAPGFLFGYQEYLLGPSFSGWFWAAQGCPCVGGRWRWGIRVSGDARSVCAVTIVGTVLNKWNVSSYNNNEKIREFKKLRQLLQTKTPH